MSMQNHFYGHMLVALCSFMLFLRLGQLAILRREPFANQILDRITAECGDVNCWLHKPNWHRLKAIYEWSKPKKPRCCWKR